jgi:hypothetical protein
MNQGVISHGIASRNKSKCSAANPGRFLPEEAAGKQRDNEGDYGYERIGFQSIRSSRENRG